MASRNTRKKLQCWTRKNKKNKRYVVCTGSRGQKNMRSKRYSVTKKRVIREIKRKGKIYRKQRKEFGKNDPLGKKNRPATKSEDKILDNYEENMVRELPMRKLTDVV